jgi:hypothetical protein
MSAHGEPVPIEGLPGADLLISGLADLRGGHDTTSAALVRMAAPRLRQIGFDIPASESDQPGGHRLYDLLSENDPAGAYSRYNALVSRMVSFAQAAEHARER